MQTSHMETGHILLLKRVWVSLCRIAGLRRNRCKEHLPHIMKIISKMNSSAVQHSEQTLEVALKCMAFAFLTKAYLH